MASKFEKCPVCKAPVQITVNYHDWDGTVGMAAFCSHCDESVTEEISDAQTTSDVVGQLGDGD